MHTVEKIGGTSMSRFDEVVSNIFMNPALGDDIYNRYFVLSAYGGITDQLLENKKTKEPGVYGMFYGGESQWAWGDKLSSVATEMCAINERIFDHSEDRERADRFVADRIEGVRSCLIDLHRLCSFGHFHLEEHLATVREMLSALGEAHSAFNTAQFLQRRNVNARFVDLTGWRDTEQPSLDERISEAIKDIDITKEMPIVTGYAQCRSGLMKTFDRGYTEITFSRLAVLSSADEAIIHKEYHLSSADPGVVGEDKVKTIGRTNYDVADQLSNLGMEAVHPRAAKGLRQSEIPLRVKNAFEPEDSGTLVRGDYKSETPCVEIIAGRPSVYAIEFFDQDMVGVHGYDEGLLRHLAKHRLRVVSKDINANTITHFVAAPLKAVKRVSEAIQEEFPNADVQVRKVAIVSAIGSDLNVQGLLSHAVNAMSDEGVSILAVHQSMRMVDMQFVVDQEDYEKTIRILHNKLIESGAGISESEAA